MERLFSVNVRLQNISRQQIAYAENKVCHLGHKIENYILNSSARVGYIIQILLRLPLLVAVQFWLLLGPYSESSTFEIFWIIIRIFVVYTMARAWIFNTKTLLLQYGSVNLEICVGLIEESIYWTFQNEANEVCHESRVVTWGDVDDLWWTPAVIVLLIESIYFWLNVYIYMKFQNLDQHCHCCVSYIAYLTPFVLPMFGVFPNLASTAVYYMTKIRLAFVLVTGIFKMETLDKKIDLQNLSEESKKCTLLQGEDKNKSMKRVQYFQSRVKLNRGKAHVINNFTTNRGVRDLLILSGLLYFGSALMLELFWYKTVNVSNFGILYRIFKFLLDWSTTIVPLMTIAACLGFVGTVVTAFAVWLVTWEISIVNAMDIKMGVAAQYSLVTLLLESGIPTTNINLDVQGIYIISFLIVYNNLHQAIDLAGSKILEMTNRGSRLPVWFYFRVLIALVLLVVAPVILLVYFADNVLKEPWILFFASGMITLISRVIFFVIEWLLVTLTWYTDRYLTVLESCINYTHVAVQVSYILLLPFQFYARYYIPAFQAWWLLRAGNLMFNYVFLVIAFVSQQKRIYDDRKRLLNLLDSLANVSYRNVSSDQQADRVCSICFSTLEDAKALPCMHVFHAECLRRWFQMRTVCPTCNSKVQ